MQRKRKKVLSNPAQLVAVDILRELEGILLTHERNIIPTKCIQELVKSKIKEYSLPADPFTGMVCTDREYVINNQELCRQIMLDTYGHYDGLE